MLSVLIPTYNYNSLALVKEIHQQLILEKINFEIICFDDGSKSILNSKNEEINSLTFSSFRSLKENIGRSAIRNLLAKTAKFKWLLFLDADVLPAHSNFIKKYLSSLNQKTVFCGGLRYQNKKQNFGLLRYKYGKKHEEIPLKVRKENSEKYFFTSNFLIEKEIFNDVKFDENLKQYGREDLLFSLDLIKTGYMISHLSNEVYHLGLDENSEFVSKTKKAMENLVFLYKQGLVSEKEMPLLNFVGKIEKIKMIKLFSGFHTFFEKQAIKKSSVFFLNCMKVCYICHLKLKNE